MSRFTESLLGIGIDCKGNKTLSGSLFEDRDFEELSLGPVTEVGLRFVVENTVFSNCTVSPGEFAVGAGVLIRNVVFDSVSADDSMTVSASAAFDHVTIKGRADAGGLWVKPDEVFDEELDGHHRRWAEEIASETDVILDISNYWAPEVTVLGWPVEKVSINSERHVRIKSEWNRRVDWERMGIGPRSFVRMKLLYLRGFNVEQGVFSLPEAELAYEKAVSELAKLRELGIC